MNRLISNRKKSLFILLALVLIASLSLYTLAYLNPFVTEDNSSTIGTMGDSGVTIEYDDCAGATCDNIRASLAPGESITKIFSVTNSGGASGTFDLFFKELKNTFNNNDIFYTIYKVDSSGKKITSGTLIEETILPYSKKTTYNLKINETGIPINAGETIKFEIEIIFKNTTVGASNDNAIFNLKLGVLEGEVKPSLPVYEGATLSKTALRNYLENNETSAIITVNTGHTGGTDISEEQNGGILAWTEGTDTYISVVDPGYNIKLPEDVTFLFAPYYFDEETFDYEDYAGLMSVASLDLTYFDTSEITDMSYMFFAFGMNPELESITISGLDTWDTSNVTSMFRMFYNTAAYNGLSCTIGNVSNWDTSNVTTMEEMFFCVGETAETVRINGLDNWDVSSVTNMANMLNQVGSCASDFSIGDLSEWDVSSVTTASNMFNGIGSSLTSGWSIGDLSNWNTTSLTNTSYMFHHAGYKATSWSIGDLSNWNVSNVSIMQGMFEGAGYSATSAWTLGDLSNWNTSSATNMSEMFYEAGKAVTGSWSIGNIASWDTSNVTDMSSMFFNAGQSAPYSLNLTSWNVSKVTNHTDFNAGVMSKISAPRW